MKKSIFTLVSVMFLGFLASAQDKNPTISLTPSGEPKIHFAVSEHDFGDIAQGTTVTHVFTFVNEGSAPLVISNIETPCGCTTPTYSREPVEPGKSGEVKVQFNSTGKSGMNIKTITVKYNSDKSPEFITIKSNVIVP